MAVMMAERRVPKKDEMMDEMMVVKLVVMMVGEIFQKI